MVILLTILISLISISFTFLNPLFSERGEKIIVWSAPTTAKLVKDLVKSEDIVVLGTVDAYQRIKLGVKPPDIWAGADFSLLLKDLYPNYIPLTYNFTLFCNKKIDYYQLQNEVLAFADSNLAPNGYYSLALLVYSDLFYNTSFLKLLKDNTNIKILINGSRIFIDYPKNLEVKGKFLIGGDLADVVNNLELGKASCALVHVPFAISRNLANKFYEIKLPKGLEMGSKFSEDLLKNYPVTIKVQDLNIQLSKPTAFIAFRKDFPLVNFDLNNFDFKIYGFERG